MKLLYAITSYNRIHLLRNTVSSLAHFAPRGDILISDDGSQDPRVLTYYDQLQKSGEAIILTAPHEANQSVLHGGLYDCMNRASEYAMEHGYTHIFFLQDDVQFMWKDESLLERIDRVFQQCHDAAMVSPIFQKKIAASEVRRRLEPHKKGNCWQLYPYGIADIGLMPVQLIQKRQWKFGSSETKNHVLWKEWGYKLYCLHAPVIAWVPWPLVYNRGTRAGSERTPRKKFFLKPLTHKQIERLSSAPLESIPFTEDFCFPWGWWCLSPYCFTVLGMEYRNNLLKAVRKGDCFPHLVYRF